MIVVETENHIVEFDGQETHDVWCKLCETIGVTQDYYMFEFDIDIE